MNTIEERTIITPEMHESWGKMGGSIVKRDDHLVCYVGFANLMNGKPIVLAGPIWGKTFNDKKQVTESAVENNAKAIDAAMAKVYETRDLVIEPSTDNDGKPVLTKKGEPVYIIKRTQEMVETTKWVRK